MTDDQPPSSAAGPSRSARRLLPASARPDSVSGPIITTPRINPVTAACESCRKHKVKCSGERPKCRRCGGRNLTCNYLAKPGETRVQAFHRSSANCKESKQSIFEELVGLLKNLPDQDAQDILRKVRSGTDVGSVLQQAKSGDVLLQMAVTPETRYRYEFPYKANMPRGYYIDNPYLKSMLVPAELTSEEEKSLYLKPFHAARVVEPLLTDAKISKWTPVCKDDELMRELIRALLRCEYQFTAAFQKDLFLQDLSAGRKSFCSPLLVNVLLSYACICYPQLSGRVEYWNPNNLTYRFMAEAKRLWELEAKVPRITTIQAGMLFAVYHNLCGLDEIGNAYLMQAVALGHQLRIFDTPVVGQSGRLQRGREYTAWALYNWETLSAFSFIFRPLIKEPPIWKLPDPSKDSLWYGEVWVNYPLNHGLSPLHLGEVIRARSQFRIIMNEYSDIAYTEGSQVDLYHAHHFRRRMENWYNSLPESLTPKRIVLPGQLQIHMIYHQLLFTMFEPLLDVETNVDPSPRHIVAIAKRNLQTLVRLYFLRHGFESMDLFIVIPLMIIGYDSLGAINDDTPPSEIEALRAVLILVAQGLYHQRRNHYLAQALFRVIRGSMRPQEIGLLKSSMALEAGDIDQEPELAVAVRSQWPVSVVKRKEDLKFRVLTNLVESFGYMNVEEET